MAACAFASRFFPLVRGRVCCGPSCRARPAFRAFSCNAARAQGSGALTGREDRFGGVTVNLSDSCLLEDISEKSFSRLLKDSLIQWKSEGKVAVWLRVPISLSRCAAAASEHGFSFHHAKHDHTVLSLWLGEGESRLPGQQHDHPGAFSMSDMYIICRLSPLTYDINFCTQECLRCEWLQLAELAKTEHTTPITARVAQLLLHGLESGFHNIDLSMEVIPAVYSGSFTSCITGSFLPH
ncbi:hypothetical protein F7725_010554 [Dissostichus mawsoni]|uniref:Nucleoside diphosphate-linked moiety X motif 6 n=1 Tax=Dissostichus mawsoni TaxID=36200 RepID=A0A7J5XNS4_DISMA|nr:hypothetical protein F7725_010554 [Dissostichus mawsoni]